MTEDIKIGLETHVQLNTDSKLFCGCPNEESDGPNENVCEICLGHPGSRPRLNRKALRIGAKVALALNCELNKEIFFSRKTYFYPDMSKNYQITQYEVPLGEDGGTEISVGTEENEIGIKRLHLEEDPAKINHKGGSVSDSNYTKLDYNRAGTPLIEIVTKPDFRSPEGAREYLKKLESILEYLDVYTTGSSFTIKSDANISMRGGEKVEVKNITGTSEVEKALKHEINRQEKVYENNEKVTQQTRSYSSERQVTKKLREKESEEDYGYIFDPDLTRQKLDGDLVESLKEEIPELPDEKKDRFENEIGLRPEVARSLVKDREMAEDYELLIEEHDPEETASWMTGELRKTLNYNELGYSESGIKTEWLSYILNLIESDKISDRNAEELIREVVSKQTDPEPLVDELDLLKAEEDEVDSIVDQVLQDNRDAVDDYLSGDEGAVNFLVGQVMQESQGKADPKTAREKIKEKIE